MAHWSLDDIPWHAFDRTKVTPDLLALAKAASMVESNGGDYARYLCEVFHDDSHFQTVAHQWANEEVQHGQALRKWAELADPSFDFDVSFHAFTEGYHLPVNVNGSVRGSRAGELLARCIVEVGTSSYYTALKEISEEPVFQVICAKIAADEFRHYKLFYIHLQDYLQKETLPVWKRLWIALGRIIESEDDELAYAYYAAEGSPGQYDRKRYMTKYMARAYPIYRSHHVARMASMTLKAAGLNANGRLARWFHRGAWWFMQRRVAALTAGVLHS